MQYTPFCLNGIQSPAFNIHFEQDVTLSYSYIACKQLPFHYLERFVVNQGLQLCIVITNTCWKLSLACFRLAQHLRSRVPSAACWLVHLVLVQGVQVEDPLDKGHRTHCWISLLLQPRNLSKRGRAHKRDHFFHKQTRYGNQS